MKQSKYNISEYWRTKISQNEKFWSGLLENQAITQDSVIITPVILNSNSDQAESAWAVYPNPQSVLGFFKYIYLPTACIGLIKKDIDYQYYFQENLQEVLNEYRGQYPNKLNLINKMESFYFELNDLWNDDNHTCLEKLKNWTIGFNEDWEETRGVSFSFQVFASPKEAAHFIVATYEEDLGIESLEDDIGLSKSEFLELASDDIYQKDFMKRKFTDILTNRLKVIF